MCEYSYMCTLPVQYIDKTISLQWNNDNPRQQMQGLTIGSWVNIVN